MRTKTANWYETKIRYEKTMENGLDKKVTELYVVDALSFTEAESCILEEMSSYISGAFRVTDIKQAPYGEICFSEATADDKWYKAKLQFITLDEKTDKEKRTSVNYLIQASSLPAAVKHIEEMMSGSLADYVISNVAETQIMDVFEHETKVKTTTE